MAVIANTKTRAVSGSHLAFTSTSPMPMHGLILSLSARGGRRFSCRSFGAGQSVQCCYSWTAAHGTRIGRPKGAGEGGYQQPTDLANIAATRLIYRGDLLDMKGSNMQVAPTLHAHGRRVQDGRQHSGFGLRQLPPCPRRRGASEGRVGLLLGGHNRKVLFITFPSHTATDVLVSAACNSAITKKKTYCCCKSGHTVGMVHCTHTTLDSPVYLATPQQCARHFNTLYFLLVLSLLLTRTRSPAALRSLWFMITPPQPMYTVHPEDKWKFCEPQQGPGPRAQRSKVLHYSSR